MIMSKKRNIVEEIIEVKGRQRYFPAFHDPDSVTVSS